MQFTKEQVEEIIKQIEKALPRKNSETFTCTAGGGKSKKKDHCPHEANGWNGARFNVLEHFKSQLRRFE